MRAMRNNKTRLVFLITAVLLLEMVSGRSKSNKGHAAHAVKHYPSSNVLQKKKNDVSSSSGTESKSSHPVHHSSVSTEEIRLLAPGYEEYQYNQLDEQERVARAAEDTVEEKVKSVVVEQLNVDPDRVTPGASFCDDLGADSLDLVELIMAMEEKFGIEIPDEDTEDLKTVGQMTDYIIRHPNDRNE